MGLLALFSVVDARKWLIVACAVAFGFLALIVGVVTPTKYQSTAVVQVDGLRKNLLTGLFEPRVRVAEFLGQQSAVAGSRTVALAVVDRLTQDRLIDAAALEDEWRRKTGGELAPGTDARLWIADQFLENLEIATSEAESTIAISYRNENAAVAARVANAFATAYMQTELNERQRRAARNALNFSEETMALEENLAIAQQELSDFREKSGIVALGDQRLESAEVDLASLTLRLAEARADQSEALSLLRQAQSAQDVELLTLPLPDEAQAGRQAQSRLGAVLVQFQRIQERYGPRYPDYIEAENEKRALERTIMRAVENRAEFANRRVEALTAAVEDKKKIVVDLQETKQAYDVLEKKVEASQETYDLVASRSLQESLHSRVDFVDLFLLSRAIPADSPTTPPVIVFLIIGLLAGFGIGAGLAVLLELVEGRVRNNHTLSHIMRAPVFATVSAPGSDKRMSAKRKSFVRRWGIAQ